MKTSALQTLCLLRFHIISHHITSYKTIEKSEGWMAEKYIGKSGRFRSSGSTFWLRSTGSRFGWLADWLIDSLTHENLNISLDVWQIRHISLVCSNCARLINRRTHLCKTRQFGHVYENGRDFSEFLKKRGTSLKKNDSLDTCTRTEPKTTAHGQIRASGGNNEKFI